MELDSQIINDFSDFGITLKADSHLFSRVKGIGIQKGWKSDQLIEEWVAFSTKHDDGLPELTDELLNKWEAKLGSAGELKQNSKTPLHNRTKMYTSKNISKLLFDEVAEDEDEEDVMGIYGESGGTTKAHVGQKRSAVDQTTPTTPRGVALGVPTKARHTSSSATPTTPLSRPTATPSRSYVLSPATESLPGTPSVRYSQRQNAGSVMCILNDAQMFGMGRSTSNKESLPKISPTSNTLLAPYHYMFQSNYEKTLALFEKIERLETKICHQNEIMDLACPSEISVEPSVYVGCVVCEGEGHLNPSSCLLEVPLRNVHKRTGVVFKLDLSGHIPCCLFPGQVIAVKGVVTHKGILVPSSIWDQGALPPFPRRSIVTTPGITLFVAAGPYTTSENLDMNPLHDLLAVVSREQPDVLILMGPFVDISHNLIKNGNLDMSFDEIFYNSVLNPIILCVKNLRTEVILVPSQRDAHHDFPVYPQPPFQLNLPSKVTCLADPCTVTVNGLCIGATSTDVLFHLSAKAMFVGAPGDRMARLVQHILQQQCYYPLHPVYRKDDTSINRGCDGLQGDVPSELNLDYPHLKHALLPTRPDILILNSDLKAFAKRVDGCVAINTGRLTKSISGGTYAKVAMPSDARSSSDDSKTAATDVSGSIAVQILQI